MSADAVHCCSIRSCGVLWAQCQAAIRGLPKRNHREEEPSESLDALPPTLPHLPTPLEVPKVNGIESCPLNFNGGLPHDNVEEDAGGKSPMSPGAWDLARKLEQITPGLPIFHLSLHDGDALRSLEDLYQVVLAARDLIVITSCFAAWKDGGCVNSHGKVIPAVPVTADGPRIFFFDDNINLHSGNDAGAANAKGICNLRDVTTGDYVDFSNGVNGFTCERTHWNTFVHHSQNYRNVLVQANILDAVISEDYFSSIIGQFRQEGEDVIVFMDVNGTILSTDTSMELDTRQMLLNTMSGFVEVRPRRASSFKYWGRDVRLDKPIILKQLMTDIHTGSINGGGHIASSEKSKIFSRDGCAQLLQELTSMADLGWLHNANLITPQEFFEAFEGQISGLVEHRVRSEAAGTAGLTKSWFKCVRWLMDEKQTVVLNSFGVDTHRVLVHSRPDPECALHLAVNSERWSERDRKQFHQQLASAATMSGR